MDITVALILISSISGFFPVLTALYNFNRLDKTLKIAGLFFLIVSLFDPAMWLLTKMGEKNNMPLLHLNILVSLGFYTLIYYRLFEKSLLKKLTIGLTLLDVVVMAIYDHDIFGYPSVANTSLSIFLIILSLLYFYQLLNPSTYIDIEKQSWFWINAGVLFYSSVNIFLFMIYTQIPVDDRSNYYIINIITNIIANILFSVGLLCKPQKTT